MRFFIRAFQIEDNHNLHCRQARASAVRQVQSPGQAKCGLPSARSATAHRGANAPDRRAPAGCISALARSGAQWSRRPRICWQRVIDHAIGHRRVRVRDAQRAPRAIPGEANVDALRRSPQPRPVGRARAAASSGKPRESAMRPSNGPKKLRHEKGGPKGTIKVST